MSVEIRHSEEPPHLISLFRQSDDKGRRDLIREMLEIALQKISAPFPLLPAASLEISQEGEEEIHLAELTLRSDPIAGNPEKAAALVASLCARMLRTEGPCDPFAFGSIAVAWAGLDSMTKLRGGRSRGPQAAYYDDLTRRHPLEGAKELFRLAEGGGGSIDAWPFGNLPRLETFRNEISRARSRAR